MAGRNKNLTLLSVGENVKRQTPTHCQWGCDLIEPC